ncbi:PTS mannose/fructose/sorbose/N-acetylgalactosamine transporter subunit IIC [Pectinatus haikarae]|uniref:PTS system mannose-specific IIC component n=1 Tax=Pectinatus haikarae TaxID=349096 RepID=A0ABT9YA63_9FIRM|nr:PTS sugar transporter subunit IIC [Pectinatus haikarae]MDQ0204611.1 PTS system mannose-specific IIC component [Pectinatus haikarae]
MTISTGQAVAIGIVYYLGNIGTPWLSLLGSISVVYKPLVAGTLVGFILGDPVQGCIIGAAINLPYVAFISAGGTAPQDPGLAGTVGTAWALAAGVSPAAAVTIALPLGLLGTMIWVLHMTLDVTFVHMADKAAERGDLDKICFLHVVPPQLLMFFLCVVPAAVATYFGSEAVQGIIANLTGTPLHILEVIGGLLPALGIAMNLRAIGRPGTLLFFMAGFVFVVYLKLPVIAVAVLGAVIAYFYTVLSNQPPAEIAGAAGVADDDEEDF